MYPQSMFKAKYNSSENYHFYSCEILQYITWACFRNGRVIAMHALFIDVNINPGSFLKLLFPCCSLDWEGYTNVSDNEFRGKLLSVGWDEIFFIVNSLN